MQSAACVKLQSIKGPNQIRSVRRETAWTCKHHQSSKRMCEMNKPREERGKSTRNEYESGRAERVTRDEVNRPGPTVRHPANEHPGRRDPRSAQQIRGAELNANVKSSQRRASSGTANRQPFQRETGVPLPKEVQCVSEAQKAGECINRSPSGRDDGTARRKTQRQVRAGVRQSDHPENRTDRPQE